MTDAAHYLPSNAIRALDQLGLGEAVAAAAHPISRQRVTGAGGRVLADLPVSTVWGEQSRCAAIRRDSLHELLLKATTDISIRLGTTIDVRLRDNAVKLSDGSVEHYDVLVGADGVDSVVRTAGIGGTEPTYTGRWAWSFIADGWDGEEGTWQARLAADHSLLTMPLGKEPSSATPTSPALMAGQPGTGETTSMISTSRSLTCWLRQGRCQATRSWKLIAVRVPRQDGVDRRRGSCDVALDVPGCRPGSRGRAGTGGDTRQPSGPPGAPRVRATAG